MRIAIAQPTYLPWLGYFDLIDQVDAFVILDSVQFEKQSWQQRNRIKTPTGLQWLTIPVRISGRSTQKIAEVELAETGFYVKHLNLIRANYRTAVWFDRFFPDFAAILSASSQKCKLVDATIPLIEWFTSALGITTPLIRSSDLAIGGRRSQLNLTICEAMGATEYYAAIGSAAYLLSDTNLFLERGISVYFQHYEHQEYTQLFPPFCSHACVLDLLFNQGPESGQIVRRGRRTPFLPWQLEPESGSAMERTATGARVLTSAQ